MRALALLSLLLATPAAARTVVSLTFDDGTASQLQAQSILDQKGVKGTFYVNSGRIGAGGYLTLAQLRAIAAAGHEVAGHTVDHLDLATLTDAQLQHQVCDDRAALVSMGFSPASFAYPFGSFNAAAKAKVQACGYLSARGVGGLSCSGCARASPIPPSDPYAIPTPDSVKNTTTLAALQKMVTDAESAGGGWVPVVMHLVCDNCDTYSISPATLASFIDWVKLRQGSGTVIQTVGEVIGGAAPPPPPPPAPTPPAVSSLSPNSAAAGGTAFTLTVNGSGFVSGAVVRWNGTPRVTTFVRATRVRAAVSAADIAFPGPALVTVRNPDGGVSAGSTFTVTGNNPVPVLAGVAPSSAAAGSAGLTLTAQGSAFVSGSVVRWNGSARPTVFVSSSQLRAQLTAADLAAAGSFPVSVFSPSPGGGTSASRTFTVAAATAAPAPAPVLSSISPSSATAGAAALTLTALGSGFVSSSTVRWSGSARATTFVSPGELRAQLSAADLASAGSFPITVFTPAPGGGTSTASSFSVAPAPSTAPVRTVVSLTFDDGSADQLIAQQLLDQRGLKGTFYINSGRIGESSFYLTLAQLRSIAAGGHEIGGHSLTHPDLTTLTTTQLQAEVCGDRAQLQGWGFDPVSFAYPFGADDQAARDMVRSCGYSSARDVGGLALAGETMPPANAFLIRTHESVVQTDTLAVIQKQVTDAESNGGGWVPIVMHRVCDGCDTYSMSSATLRGLLDWLKAREGAGTVVRTVREVMTGTAPAAPPSLASLSPSSAAAGGAGFTLTVNGASFASGAAVLWNGAPRSTTFVSASQLRAAVLSSDLASTGTASVSVRNPDGQASAASPFTIAAPSAPPPPASALFADAFDRPDGLITNEYAYWNPTDPASRTSPDWRVTAGSFFVSGGAGWTGVPDAGAPDAGSTNATGSAVFRAVTKRTDFGDADASFTLVNRGFVTTSATPAQAYDGVRLALRYLGETSYYELSLNRRDNTAVIKKRSGSALTTLASTPYAVPLNAAQSVLASARNNADGSVSLTLSIGGRQLLSAVDASSPLRAAGALGLRSDNADFRVDQLSVAAPAQTSVAVLRAASAGAAATTVVSLTFDDGSADQLTALRLLDQRGLKGTFYVNSAKIGEPGDFYLTLAELRQIAASGHEIGGHSLTHPDLTTLDPDSLRREVCGDRENLRAWGFDPVSFAYPFGADNQAVREMARACGWQSARDVGGLGAAERVPPVDRYAVRTHESITPADTVADLQEQVLSAERAGGGWVPIVMHRVCDGCSQYSMTERTLASFLDWLAARRGSGTVVRTVRQVMSGEPSASGPADPPSVPTAVSLDEARLYPNPWRADRHAGLPVTIDGLPPGSTVRLFTVSGRFLRSIDAPSGSGRWDLDDGGGRKVASGLYLYLATDPAGGRRRGVLAVLK